MEFDELFYDGEAEAETAVLARGRGIGLAETLEEIRKEFGSHSGAGVAHTQHEVVVVALQAHIDPPMRGREFDRVGQQVPDDLLESGAIAHHLESPRSDVGEDADFFEGGGGMNGVDGSGDDGGEIDALDGEADFAGGDAAHVEEILDELGLNAGVAFDDVEAVGEFLGGVGAFLEDLSPTEDRIERSAKLVRERGEKFVLEAAGALGLGARGAFAFEQALALGGGGVAIGDVAHDFGEAEASAAGIDNDDHEAGDEETGAVFFDVPAIVGGTTGRFRGGEFFFRFAASLVFGREENSSGATEDLAGGIAEQAFGAGVPMRDQALVVEEDDRVFRQALDDEPIAGFDFEQIGFDLFLPGDIECDAFEMRGLCSDRGKRATRSVNPAEGAVGRDGAKFDVVVRALGDGAIDGIAHAGAVLGVDAGVEGVDVDWGIRRKEELLLRALAPRERATGQIPGKGADFGGFGGEVELFAQLSETLGCGAKFADIEKDAGEPDRLADGVAVDAPAGEHAARGFDADDAIFDLAALTFGDGGFDAFADERCIVGMDALEVSLERCGGGFVRRETKPVREAVVAVDGVARKLPDPSGHVAGEYRCFETRARFLKRTAMDGEFAVGLFEFVGATSEFFACGFGARAERGVSRSLGALDFLEPNPIGHVLDAVNEMGDAALGIDHGSVPSAPVAALEAAGAARCARDVVAQRRNLVAFTGGDRGLERFAERVDAECVGRVGVVREDFENWAAHNLLSRGVGGAQVGVVGGGDREVVVGAQDQIRVGGGLEDGLKRFHGTRRGFRGRWDERVPWGGQERCGDLRGRLKLSQLRRFGRAPRLEVRKIPDDVAPRNGVTRGEQSELACDGDAWRGCGPCWSTLFIFG